MNTMHGANPPSGEQKEIFGPGLRGFERSLRRRESRSHSGLVHVALALSPVDWETLRGPATRGGCHERIPAREAFLSLLLVAPSLMQGKPKHCLITNSLLEHKRLLGPRRYRGV
jgi:hypothetical protein